MKLKLYVWDGPDILADYFSGMIVAIAPDLRAAKAAARKAYGSPSDYLESSLRQRPIVVRLDESTRPRAWCVSGGG